jgi:hypothetical protein
MVLLLQSQAIFADSYKVLLLQSQAIFADSWFSSFSHRRSLPIPICFSSFTLSLSLPIHGSPPSVTGDLCRFMVLLLQSQAIFADSWFSSFSHRRSLPIPIYTLCFTCSHKGLCLLWLSNLFRFLPYLMKVIPETRS